MHIITTICLFTVGVVAHGHVRSHVMDSHIYTGYLPVPTPDFTLPPPSIVRRVGGDGPVKNLASNDIACNINAAPISDSGVSRVGTVTAGNNISFHWPAWPHSGPILTWMARCDPDCGNFTGWGTNSWFKIDQMGYGTNWATQWLFNHANTWSSRVPACLLPGEYLVRHEIIALSECSTVGNCQFYPSCAQVKVVGNGSVVPKNLVAFPGAYDPKDPGILWDANTQDPKTYVIPGPSVFICP